MMIGKDVWDTCQHSITLSFSLAPFVGLYNSLLPQQLEVTLVNVFNFQVIFQHTTLIYSEN